MVELAKRGDSLKPAVERRGTQDHWSAEAEPHGVGHSR